MENEDNYYEVGNIPYKVSSQPQIEETINCITIKFTIRNFHKEYKVIIIANKTNDKNNYNINSTVNDNQRMPVKEDNIALYKQFYLQLIKALRGENKCDAEELAMKIFCLLTNLNVTTLKKNNLKQEMERKINKNNAISDLLINNFYQVPRHDEDMKKQQQQSFWDKFWRCPCCQRADVDKDETNLGKRNNNNNTKSQIN